MSYRDLRAANKLSLVLVSLVLVYSVLMSLVPMYLVPMGWEVCGAAGLSGKNMIRKLSELIGTRKGRNPSAGCTRLMTSLTARALLYTAAIINRRLVRRRYPRGS